MATFFGEVVTGSYRHIDPDQPDYNEGVQQTWSLDTEVEQEKNLLIVTEGSIAENYMKMLLVNNDQMRRVAGITSDQEMIDVVRSDQLTLVSCSGHETGNIGHVVMSLAQSDTCHVLVITARHVSQLRVADPRASAVYCLGTKLWSEERPCPSLPQPSIISGVTAALMTRGQVSGRRVLAIIVFTEILRPDSLSLEPLKIIHKIGSVSRAGLKSPVNIASELGKLKLFSCPDNIYM